MSTEKKERNKSQRHSYCIQLISKAICVDCGWALSLSLSPSLSISLSLSLSLSLSRPIPLGQAGEMCVCVCVCVCVYVFLSLSPQILSGSAGQICQKWAFDTIFQ